MNIDARNLSQSTTQYMANNGFTVSTFRVDDGGWEKCGLLYLIEQKTERESFTPPSNWWKYDNDSLLTQRVYIRDNYRSSNRLEFHQNKWMIAIAQLRKDILGIRRVGRGYRAIFSIPVAERDNFNAGFQRYHLDSNLNTYSHGLGVNLNFWNPTYTYIDQRGVTISAQVIEIDQQDYFGQI